MFREDIPMPYLLVFLKMVKEMGKVSWDIKTEGNMKEIGKTIWDMEEALKDIQMVILTMGSSNLVRLMVKVSIHGKMVKFMMENGMVDWNTVMEFGKVFMVILILENGEFLKLKDMVFIHGKMGIDMKANGNIAWNMAKVQTFLTMEMFILENIRMESLMVKVSILGEMVKFMWVNLKMVLNMGKENGDLQKDNSVINMKETMWVIRSMDLEYFNGQVETVIKANTKMMRETVLVRWNGLMVVHIKETGLEEFNMVKVKWYFQTDQSKMVTLSSMFIKVAWSLNHNQRKVV
jgi:hypothetical protein